MSDPIYFLYQVPVRTIIISYVTDRGWMATAKTESYETETVVVDSPVIALKSLLRRTTHQQGEHE